MKTIRMVLALLALTFLVGCETTNPSPPQFRNIFIKPSASMTQNCAIAAPMRKEDFLKLSNDDQKKILAEYSVKLLGDLKNCNDRFGSLREWYVEQEKLYAKDNPK